MIALFHHNMKVVNSAVLYIQLMVENRIIEKFTQLEYINNYSEVLQTSDGTMLVSDSFLSLTTFTSKIS